VRVHIFQSKFSGTVLQARRAAVKAHTEEALRGILL
jgi:hypothetical protein